MRNVTVLESSPSMSATINFLSPNTTYSLQVVGFDKGNASIHTCPTLVKTKDGKIVICSVIADICIAAAAVAAMTAIIPAMANAATVATWTVQSKLLYHQHQHQHQCFLYYYQNTATTTDNINNRRPKGHKQYHPITSTSTVSFQQIDRSPYSFQKSK